jgi:hypothetical protein
VVHKKSCSKLINVASFSIEKILFPALTVPPLSHLTSCTHNKSNVHLANSLSTTVSERELYRLLTIQIPNLMSLLHCFVRTKISRLFLQSIKTKKTIIYNFISCISVQISLESSVGVRFSGTLIYVI